MIQPDNGQSVSRSDRPKPRRHNAKRCALVVRQRIVTALAQGDSQRSIARALRVSPSTVSAVAAQEWEQVEARKARIAAQAELNATLAAERITSELQSGKHIPITALVPVFGVSVDKIALLKGEPSLAIHHVHTYSHQLELVAALNAACERIEKRAKAAVVEVPALPPRNASVAGENAAQKAG